MTKMLDVPDDKPRILAPTTTAKLAQRMLYASRAIADILPLGLYGSPGLDILLALHLAEESAQYLSADELVPPGSISMAVTSRWIDALVDRGLVARRGDMLALSEAGHAAVINLIEAVYTVQRSLD